MAVPAASADHRSQRRGVGIHGPVPDALGAERRHGNLHVLQTERGEPLDALVCGQHPDPRFLQDRRGVPADRSAPAGDIAVAEASHVIPIVTNIVQADGADIRRVTGDERNSNQGDIVVQGLCWKISRKTWLVFFSSGI